MSTVALVGAVRSSGTGRRAGLSVACERVVLGPLVMAIVAALVYAVLTARGAAFDYQHAYWSAGHRLLTGADPYAWTPGQVSRALAFVYPALSALVFVPISLVPRGVGEALFTFVCIGMVPATLWTLRVRDWRIYSVTQIWTSVVACWQTSNETVFLVLASACVWRLRDRPWAVALLTAAAISLKPLMWPLALWLLVTRRWRACAYTLVLGLVFNLVAWAVVGFGEIAAYTHAAAMDTRYAWHTGYSLAALAAHLGSGRFLGELLIVLSSVALTAAVAYTGLVKRRELQAFVLTCALVLAASPMLWSHYFAILLVPLALLRPRLHWLWVLPIMMWLAPPTLDVHAWQVALCLLVAAVIVAVLAHQAGGAVPDTAGGAR